MTFGSCLLSGLQWGNGEDYGVVADFLVAEESVGCARPSSILAFVELSKLVLENGVAKEETVRLWGTWKRTFPTINNICRRLQKKRQLSYSEIETAVTTKLSTELDMLKSNCSYDVLPQGVTTAIEYIEKDHKTILHS